MLPSIPMAGGGANSKLSALYRGLCSEDQQTLMAFAEFLKQRSSLEEESRPRQLQLPGNMERPQKESVVAAIRRLSSCYPMLDKETLLHETSDLMSSHVLKGRAAIEVIDDLEELFSSRYDEYRNELEQD